MTATILIVDDSATMRALVRGALEADQHAVVEAPNGEAALATLAGMSTGVDLVITDVIMPQMDGLSLTRALRDDPRFAATPILVLGHAENLLGLASDMRRVTSTIYRHAEATANQGAT